MMSMFLRVKTTVLFLILSTGAIYSQQIPFSNQYYVNRHFLSPAYSGFTNNYETFISHRKDWLGFQGAPENSSIYTSGPIYKNFSFGGSIAKNSVTIFNEFSASIDFAYHLKVNENQFVHFGLSYEYIENFLDIGNQDISVQKDPYVMQHNNSFNAGFGLVYSYKTFQIGMVLPRIFDSKMGISSNNIDSYKFSKYFRVHSSCLFNINRLFSLEPIVIIDRSNFQPLWYNISTVLKYNEITWLDVNYGQGGIVGFGIGARPMKKILINYSYEFSGTGIMKNTYGNHEISIGILIGKNSESKYQKSYFRSQNNQPYTDWVK
jgi:type IX secretion system PorP/SprF family membrane protein